MKIEIDLDDVLGSGEYGGETLKESVRRQAVDAVVKDINKSIEDEIRKAAHTAIQESVATELPKILQDMMTTTVVPVDKYGNKGLPTTLHSELIKTITDNMTYKKANYDSEKNAFTKCVDSLVGVHLESFRKEFHKTVDANFLAEAMEYTVTKLKDRLKIK